MSNDSIKRIYRSRSDIENLSRLRTSIPTEIDTSDYKNIVVNKPWGYEYLMFENRYVAIWILFLKQNCSTSMHCHPNKKASYIVLAGKVVCSHLEGWIEREEGQGLIIDEGVFHSSKAISKLGAIIMEIESPPNKKDLVRLKDEYGREHQGYEGSDKMSGNIKAYEYIDFHKTISPKKHTKKIRNCHISLYIGGKNDDVYEQIKQESEHIICMLQGKLHDKNGATVLSTGEAVLLSEIQAYGDLTSFGTSVYLTIDHKKLRNKNNA